MLKKIFSFSRANYLPIWHMIHWEERVVVAESKTLLRQIFAERMNLTGTILVAARGMTDITTSKILWLPGTGSSRSSSNSPPWPSTKVPRESWWRWRGQWSPQTSLLSSPSSLTTEGWIWTTMSFSWVLTVDNPSWRSVSWSGNLLVKNTDARRWTS